MVPIRWLLTEAFHGRLNNEAWESLQDVVESPFHLDGIHVIMLWDFIIKSFERTGQSRYKVNVKLIYVSEKSHDPPNILCISRQMLTVPSLSSHLPFSIWTEIVWRTEYQYLYSSNEEDFQKKPYGHCLHCQIISLFWSRGIMKRKWK